MNPLTALEQLGASLDNDRPQLTKFDSYFHANQPLNALREDVRRALGNRLAPVCINWARIAVCAKEERLDIEGFRAPSRTDLERELWRIWQANGLDETSSQAHVDALVYGRSFIMVWAGTDPRTPRITVESPLQVITETDPATGLLVAGIKRWRDTDRHQRVDVYLPDYITHFRSRTQQLDPPHYSIPATAYEVVGETDNPLGVVPIVPLINRQRPLKPLGESELVDVVPVLDSINKVATDLMTGSEHYAMPRRWVTGFSSAATGGRLSPDQLAGVADAIRSEWEQARASKVWISDSPETKFGQFPEATLDNFIGAIRMFTLQLSAIAGLPPHYVALSAESNPASADAIRSAEASLVNRARRLQRSWGGAWEDVMRLALTVRDGVPPAGLDDLEVVWRSAEIVSIAQAADAAVKLHAEGILDRRAVLEDLDYSPQAITQITNA